MDETKADYWAVEKASTTAGMSAAETGAAKVSMRGPSKGGQKAVKRADVWVAESVVLRAVWTVAALVAVSVASKEYLSVAMSAGSWGKSKVECSAAPMAPATVGKKEILKGLIKAAGLVGGWVVL